AIHLLSSLPTRRSSDLFTARKTKSVFVVDEPSRLHAQQYILRNGVLSQKIMRIVGCHDFDPVISCKLYQQRIHKSLFFEPVILRSEEHTSELQSRFDLV